MKKYIINNNCNLNVLRNFNLSINNIIDAVHFSHDKLSKLKDFDINISQLLGLRNLSGFVGEIFASSMVKTNDAFQTNPHQDGYPDLLLMDDLGKIAWNNFGSQLRNKSPFSPFFTGGIEIKATCGSVPNDKKCRELGYSGKPTIGDQRIALINSYDWKAHHQKTDILLGLVYDFIEENICIVGIFYNNNLDTKTGKKNKDWGDIIKPKERGGKTTSVSIMTKFGVRKMYEGWVAVLDDDKYISFFDKYNKGNLLMEHKTKYN